MRERGILFSAPMVRAILAGTKTQTRRVVRFCPPFINHDMWKTAYQCEDGNWGWTDADRPIAATKARPGKPCPYGVPGDRMWVRETWAADRCYDHLRPSAIPRSVHFYYGGGIVYNWHKSRSARFMPRRASRILLELTEIRVQRVQEISEEDAKAEGADLTAGVTGPMCGTYRGAFCRLWDSINAKRGYGWDTNPWVWALSFRRLPAPEAEAKRDPC